MGTGASKDQQRHQAIEQQLRAYAREARDVIKLLLLGAGESGKTTILKQMRIIHDGGFRDEEILAQRDHIYRNLFECILAISKAMIQLGIEYECVAEREIDVSCIQKQLYCLESSTRSTAKKYTVFVTAELASAVMRFWRDTGVQQCYDRSNEYQLNDSAKYFFENAQRICMPDFLPNAQDVLRTRVQTTGIVEVMFSLCKQKFRVVDVGGQKSLRRKWLHCFDDVTAIIFIAAISEYDQVMREDSRANRLHDALLLFDAVCSCPHFTRSSIILFLNKKDIFEEKILKRPLTIAFPRYGGRLGDASEASSYVQRKFVSVNKSSEREIYNHFTCATDTRQIEVVLSATTDIILESTLQRAAIIKPKKSADILVIVSCSYFDAQEALKQQKQIIHANGFSNEELRDNATFVRQNLAECVLALLNAMINLDIAYEKFLSKVDITFVQQQMFYATNASPTKELAAFPELVEAVCRLLADSGIQNCKKRLSEYQLMDSAALQIPLRRPLAG